MTAQTRRGGRAAHRAYTLATEPDPAVWRARCLLAQSIVNQRATADGLSRDDAAAVAGALAGVWDRP
jgi:hypothetical protein